MTFPTEDKKIIRETIDDAGDDRLVLGETEDDKIALFFDGHQATLTPEDAKHLAEIMLKAAEDLIRKARH
jgi:TRAP-type C4-dicarboxylate transport system substrate-binding protein